MCSLCLFGVFSSSQIKKELIKTSCIVTTKKIPFRTFIWQKMFSKLEFTQIHFLVTQSSLNLTVKYFVVNCKLKSGD